MIKAKSRRKDAEGASGFDPAGLTSRDGTCSHAGHRTPTAASRFTIMEMLIVIAVISILAGLLMPAVVAVRTRAREGAVRAEIASLDMAMTSYFQNHAAYPDDDDDNPDANRARRAGQALVAALDEDAYFDFDPGRLRDAEINGDGGDSFVFINRFGGNAYYRFRNNYDRERPFVDDEDAPRYYGEDDDKWSDAVDDWNVSCVKRNSVDIWTADSFDEDFVDWWLRKNAEFIDESEVELDDGRHMPAPTFDNLRGQQRIQREYKTISNWQSQ